MNHDRLTVMLDTLCCFFCLKKPLLATRNSKGGGRYSFKHLRRKGRLVGSYRRRIYLSLQYSHGVESLMIHEFAHYLCHSRAAFRPDRTGDHGPGFRVALTEVAAAWYGHPLRYPWEHEHESLRKLGPRMDVMETG